MVQYPVAISQSQLSQFCQRWKIDELALFGSVLRDDFRPASDIDVLVTFLPEATWGLFDHVKIEQELVELFGRKVDLISKRAVLNSQNWLRREEILNNTHVIFSSKDKINAA